MYVIGMGEKKTPQPFVVACNKFKYLEALAKDEAMDDPLDTVVTSPEVVREAIRQIVDEISDEDGWTPLSDIGNTLVRRFPDFDVRNYGFTKLTPFIKRLKSFEIKSVKTSNENIKLIYIKNKE